MDCSSLQKTKLLLGKFSSDLSWLLVASVLKRIAFDVKSVESRIVYQILGGDDDNSLPNSDNHQNAINFKVEDGISTSYVFQFIPADKKAASPSCGTLEVGSSPIYDVTNLRRSKRRNVQPDRFLGCDIPPGSDVGWVRMLPIKTDKGEEEDLYLPLSQLLDGQTGSNCSEEYTEAEISLPLKRKSNGKPREMKSGVSKQTDPITELAIVPVPAESDTLAFYQYPLPPTISGTCSRKTDEISPKYYLKGSCSVQRRNTSKLKDEFESLWEEKPPNKKVHSRNSTEIEDMGNDSRSWRRPSEKKVSNRYRPISFKSEECCEKVSRKRTSLNAGAFNRLINSYMKNIDSTITNEEPNIVDQWNNFKGAKTLDQSMEMEQSSSENESEISENDMLWKEMELSMASAYILEDEVSCNYSSY